METNQCGQSKPQIIKDGARSSKSPKIQAAIIEKNRAWIDGQNKESQPTTTSAESTSSEKIPSPPQVTQNTGDLLRSGNLPSLEGTTEQSVSATVQVYVTSGESKNCYTVNEGTRLEVSGDLHGVMNPMCAAIAMHVKRVIGPVGLEDSRDKRRASGVQLTEALGVNLKSHGNDQDSMSFKNVVHILRDSLQEGQVDSLQSALAIFARVCCDLEPWSEAQLLQSDEGGPRRAYQEAKDFRSKYSDRDLKKGIVINCNLFKSPIHFGERVGPKPETEDEVKTVPYSGTFGGYLRQEKVARWSHEGDEQKRVDIKMDTDIFYEKVRSLSPLEPIYCTILVVETYKNGQLHEIKLQDITSVKAPLVRATEPDKAISTTGIQSSET